jgi:hypothetical protein
MVRMEESRMTSLPPLPDVDWLGRIFTRTDLSLERRSQPSAQLISGPDGVELAEGI